MARQREEEKEREREREKQREREAARQREAEREAERQREQEIQRQREREREKERLARERERQEWARAREQQDRERSRERGWGRADVARDERKGSRELSMERDRHSQERNQPRHVARAASMERKVRPRSLPEDRWGNDHRCAPSTERDQQEGGRERRLQANPPPPSQPQQNRPATDVGSNSAGGLGIRERLLAQLAQMHIPAPMPAAPLPEKRKEPPPAVRGAKVAPHNSNASSDLVLDLDVVPQKRRRTATQPPPPEVLDLSHIPASRHE